MSVGDSQNVSTLSGALATVAIASLGGPLPAAGVALGQVVKFAQSRYLAGADSRELRRGVQDTIKAWAQSEHISDDDRRIGLTLAADVTGKHGADWDTIARLSFDAARVTNAVVKHAEVADSRWGSEPHYGVAERAIQQTYGVLIRGVRAKQGPLLDAVQAARAEITDAVAGFTAMGQQQSVSLGELQRVLIAGATDADVMVYLRARILDWDKSLWLPAGRKPSSLERRLRGLESGVELSADEALVGRRLLAVLGGPGAGKTWLAKRYARLCAQQALAALEAGSDLLGVEIPVDTTWDGWTNAAGDTRRALVAASFAAESGHSDLGGAEIVDRLTRTFTAGGQAILAVVDSLDEAAASKQTTRIFALESVTGWRFVVTSRPSAWKDTTGARDLRGWRVMTLLDLDPAAVAGFVDAWFAGDPARSAVLKRQLEDRVQISVIPLLLTFLCLLTETAENPDLPLPVARRALYQQLLDRLVLSAWANTPPGERSRLETDEVLDLLTRWAWQAVEHSNTPAGLGNWSDTFTPTMKIPDEFSDQERRALDNIALRTSDGQRRFIHRTLLEHLVAEHISSRSTLEATDLLLPHIWYDTDWEWVIPAAIASHNREHPGELFESVMARISYPHSDPARTFAYTSAIELLLRVIVESNPEDWSADDAEWLGGLRPTWVGVYPGLVARSAHWTASNSDVINTVARLLAEGDSREELLNLLHVCAQTVVQRGLARELLLTRLSSASPEATSDLATVLSRLSTNAEEREVVRNSILHLIEGSARDDQMSFLASALISLDPTQGETDRAFTRLLNAFFTVDLRWFTRHVASLKDYLPLAQSGPRRAHELLTSDPDGLDAVQFARLLIALPILTPPDVDRSRLREVAIRRYRTDGKAAFVYLTFLPLLEPRESQKREIRLWLMDQAPTCDAQTMPPLVSAFVRLDPSEEECASLGRLASGLAATAEPRQIPDIVATALVLGVAPEDRTELLTALVRALINSDVHPEAIPTITEGILDAGAGKAELRNIVLGVVPEADAFGLVRLGVLMFGLDPTIDDLGTLQEAATARSGTAAIWEAVPLVALIGAIGKSAEAYSVRNVAVGLFEDRLPNVGSSELAPLLALTGVTGVDEKQMGPVRQSILDVLDEGDSSDVPFLVNRLRVFSTFEEWLRWLSGSS